MLDINNIYNMDCVEGLKLIDDNTVDLTVTSPPYDDLRQYKNGYSFDFESLCEQLYRVTKEGGVVVWVVGDATHNGDETGTSFKQALFFKSVGFKLLDTMIHEKNGLGACGSNNCYIQNFEYMFVFTKGDVKTHNLIYDRLNKTKPGVTTSNTGRNIHTSDTGRKTRTLVSKEYGRRFNIWKYNQSQSHDSFSRQHPAPFPEQLVFDHIITWSNEGDLVLDPFMGSGTTGKVAYSANRDYLGFELSTDYFNLAEQRINSVKHKSKLW